MSTGLSEQARERLSRLADGEGAPDDWQQLLAAGRESPEAWGETLENWHLYHLVGDVMRSDELAGRGKGDAVFLARLRERLADEPVVMAPAALAQDEALPQPLQAAGGAAFAPRPVSRRRWRAPLAAAAGVMVVAGVAMMTGLPARQGGGAGSPTMLTQAPAPGAPASSAASPATAGPRLLTANGPLLRDARLDQYLSAHQQFGGSSALGVPSGFLRSATYEGPSH